MDVNTEYSPMISKRYLVYLIQEYKDFELMSSDLEWDKIIVGTLIQRGKEIFMANSYAHINYKSINFFKNYIVRKIGTNYKFHVILSREQRSLDHGKISYQERAVIYPMAVIDKQGKELEITQLVINHVYCRTCGKDSVHAINRLSQYSPYVPGSTRKFKLLNSKCPENCLRAFIGHERHLMFNPQGLGPTNQIATSLHPKDHRNNTVLDMTGPFIASCKTGLCKSKF